MAASTKLSAAGSGGPIPESVAQQLINTYMTEEGYNHGELCPPNCTPPPPPTV
ncbi:MAG TPA: hypothetical protein VF939_23735 [Puia sp.]